MVRLCQGTAAGFVPSTLWSIAPGRSAIPDLPGSAEFILRPRYRSERPLESMLLKAHAGSDAFTSEKYADDLAAILGAWSTALLRSNRDTRAIEASLAPTFRGASLKPVSSASVRSSSALQVRRNKFGSDLKLDSKAFFTEWTSWLSAFSRLDVAEFQVTRIDVQENAANPGAKPSLSTEVRYEIAGAGKGFHRAQRVGNWRMQWLASSEGRYQLSSLETLDEAEAVASSPFYVDITPAVLGSTASYSAQMAHGSDYWRTVIDGACGIDVYGHNGVSWADINGDGLDDLYVCQPAGLPNRLYRNRGDGTFEDITDVSGLGVLENTSCALFADFNNDGHQDAVIVRANGPLLFLNDGTGKFHLKPDAFRFASPPQGTFTGAAAADYDRDGWLDIYFCLYSYYQGTGQYRYPSPYHDAENGPPNFLMRNRRDGSFGDVTAESGMNRNNTRYSFCCAWGDYNADGWPDLYVVNDFGRKNLFRNNGDGTFTDTAPAAGAEDLGAGMSVSWLDYDNDAAKDLYVANMWTAAGLRVSQQDTFRKDSPEEVRALYQKHAMGNSLLRNSGSTFLDQTHSSGTGVGRWAWSSDAIDFDHDGHPDIYIANGMVSGAQRSDLNSFFWRQVVANSPEVAAQSHQYEQGWAAINELIRDDGTWSGYERNIFYANNGDGTFSDVSAALGLDFIEDSRSFALADIDQDGRLEIVLKNRNAPQLRILKNVARDLPPSVIFRLQGTKSNPNAVGASVTVSRGTLRQTQTVRVGSGFLSQHSKELLFGLGLTEGAVHAEIRWPSGLVQEIQNVPPNHRIWVREGNEPERIEPFKESAFRVNAGKGIPAGEILPQQVETWLLMPVPALDFSLADLHGTQYTISAMRGKPVVLHFWTSKAADCISELRAIEKAYGNWPARLLSINVDEFAASSDSQQAGATTDLNVLVRKEGFSFPILRGTDDVVAIYNLLYRQIFDRHRDMSLPASFLINESGSIVKIYSGPLDPKTVQQDFSNIPKSDAERLARGLPFATPTTDFAVGRNHLSIGSVYFQRGYLEQARAFFQQALQDDPTSAEAMYGIGSVYLNQNNNAAAREMFERAVKQAAGYPDTVPDAWNNLGVIATRENNLSQAIQDFESALKVNPNHLLSLNNLGNAYRLQKQWSDARRVLEHAVAIAPNDAEANYSLGMVYAQTNDNAKAYEHLQRALRARPDYPEALNNLGVLYLITRRTEDAVATFKQCIQVAPAFDQAYLNLARVYALQGQRDRARDLLNDLLKRRPDHLQARQMLQQLQQ